MFWLPTHIPSSAMIVLSTVDSDTANIEELSSRKFHMIHIKPLPNEYKHKMCVVSWCFIDLIVLFIFF